MLVINNLTKKFKKNTVLDSLSLTLDNGIYGFIGPNGAGKTTMIRCITGSYHTPKGAVTLDGCKSGTKEYAYQLGYLPQSFGLLKDMKVEDMIYYMSHLKGMKDDDIKKDLDNVLDTVNLKDKAHDKVGSLSGGMLRRLGIAQAMIGNPKLMIFDEPTAGLDPEERIRFKKIISSLSKDRIVIISTHIASDVERLCDKVLVMNKGRILFNDELQKIEELGQRYEAESTTESLLEKGYLWLLSQE